MITLEQKFPEEDLFQADSDGLRKGQLLRGQMFSIDSSRCRPLNALRGQENDFNCQNPEPFKISSVAPEGVSEEIHQSLNLVWQNKWPLVILYVIRVKLFFQKIKMMSHPQFLNSIQLCLINDQSAKGIQDGWGQGRFQKQEQFQQLINSRDSQGNSLMGKMKFYVNHSKKLKFIMRISRKAYKQFKILTKSTIYFLLHVIPLINSQSSLYIVWDILIFFVSLVSCIYLPFEMAFTPHDQQYSKWRYAIQSIVLYLFLTNSIIQMNLSYFDEDCTIIRDKKMIIKNYIRKNLLADVLLIFSLAIFESFESFIEQSLRIAVFCWRIVYRNANIERILNHQIYTDYGKALRNLFVLFQKILLCSHLFACYFYIIGEQSSKENGKSWLTFNSQKMNDSVQSKYINSFYFAVVTMSTIGYGDIAPITDQEKVFMTFMALIASMLFGYTINSLATIFAQYDQNQLAYTQKYEQLNMYFRDHQIDSALQNRSKQYLEFMEKGRNMQQYSNKCLDYLSPFLKEEILRNVNSQTVNKIQILNDNFSYSFLQSLSNSINEQIFAPDEPIILSKHRSQPAIFFIHKGKAELYIQFGENNSNNIVSFGIKKEGEVFGLREFFFNSEQPSISVRSKGISVIHMIYLRDFHEQLKVYPGDRQTFMNIRDNIIFNRNTQIISEKCLSCYDISHDTLSCPCIDYFNQKSLVIEKSQKEHDQRMRQFKRRKKQKSNVLKIFEFLNSRIESFQINNLGELLLYEDEFLENIEADEIDTTDQEQNNIEGEELEPINLNYDEKLDQIEEINTYMQDSPKNNKLPIMKISSIRTPPSLERVSEVNEEKSLQKSNSIRFQENQTHHNVIDLSHFNNHKSGLNYNDENLNLPSDLSEKSFRYRQSEYQDQIIQGFEESKENQVSNSQLHKNSEIQMQNIDSDLVINDETDFKRIRSSNKKNTIAMQAMIINTRENMQFEQIKNFAIYKPKGNFNKILEKIQNEFQEKQKFQIMNSPQPLNQPKGQGQRRYSKLLGQMIPLTHISQSRILTENTQK